MLYDLFVCYAHEDKDKFVKPLVKLLKANQVEVWFDEFSLSPGSSLRRSIDDGLTKSRFGIVVLSKHFFRKKWPQWELDGLVQRNNQNNTNIIIPIWLNVSEKYISQFSPSLANIIAIKSDGGLKYIVKQVLKILKPKGSTLIIARDHLIKLGIKTPVISDDWWLRLVEFSASNPAEDTFQEPMGLGRWGFPLPHKSEDPIEMGERLAMTAIQMMRQTKVKSLQISQITHPNEVLKFIDSEPKLKELCHENIEYLASYAPQLTIKGFGGEFENDFEKWFQSSLQKQRVEQKNKSKSGTGLTTNRLPPVCEEMLALRHSTFGNYEPNHIAHGFVFGYCDFGPEVKVYDIIDYIAWLLSGKSYWIPKLIRAFLLRGFKEWALWPWSKYPDSDSEFPPEIMHSTGVLFDTLCSNKNNNEFLLTKECINDILSRFKHSINILKLNESADILMKRFFKEKFIEEWFLGRKNIGNIQVKLPRGPI